MRGLKNISSNTHKRDWISSLIEIPRSIVAPAHFALNIVHALIMSLFSNIHFLLPITGLRLARNEVIPRSSMRLGKQGGAEFKVFFTSSWITSCLTGVETSTMAVISVSWSTVLHIWYDGILELCIFKTDYKITLHWESSSANSKLLNGGSGMCFYSRTLLLQISSSTSLTVITRRFFSFIKASSFSYEIIRSLNKINKYLGKYLNKSVDLF